MLYCIKSLSVNVTVIYSCILRHTPCFYRSANILPCYSLTSYECRLIRNKTFSDDWIWKLSDDKVPYLVWWQWDKHNISCSCLLSNHEQITSRKNLLNAGSLINTHKPNSFSGATLGRQEDITLPLLEESRFQKSCSSLRNPYKLKVYPWWLDINNIQCVSLVMLSFTHISI